MNYYLASGLRKEEHKPKGSPVILGSNAADLATPCSYYNVSTVPCFAHLVFDSKQLQCLNSGSASFWCRIWRPITSLRRARSVPIQRLFQMQPTTATFFSLFLEDARLLSFMASHIPRFFACPKKTIEREKIATSHSVDRDCWGAGRDTYIKFYMSYCKSRWV